MASTSSHDVPNTKESDEVNKTTDSDPLEVVEGESLKQLLQALKDAGPQASSMYSAVKTYVRWNKEDPNVHCLILTPVGGAEDGMCCLLLDREVCVRLVLYAKECDKYKLMNALKNSARIPWRRVTQVARLPERMIDHVRIILSMKQCIHVVDELNELVWLPAEEALALPEPNSHDGIRLRELTVDDSLRLAANWPHAAKDAVQLITDTIRFNGGLGAEDERGELLGWVLYNHFGGLGQLFVYPGHRRKGVGRLLAITISKKIAKTGDLVTANVITKNDPSVGLLRSLNFRHGFFNVYIQMVKPKKEDHKPDIVTDADFSKIQKEPYRFKKLYF